MIRKLILTFDRDGLYRADCNFSGEDLTQSEKDTLREFCKDTLCELGDEEWN